MKKINLIKSIIIIALVLFVFIPMNIYAEGDGGAIVLDDLITDVGKKAATETSGIGIYDISKPVDWDYRLYGTFFYNGKTLSIDINKSICIISGTKKFTQNANEMQNNFIPADEITNSTNKTYSRDLLLKVDDAPAVSADKILYILNHQKMLEGTFGESYSTMMSKIKNNEVQYEFDMYSCVDISAKIKIPASQTIHMSSYHNGKLVTADVPVEYEARLTTQSYPSINDYYTFTSSSKTFNTGEYYKNKSPYTAYRNYVSESSSRIYGVVHYSVEARKALAHYYYQLTDGNVNLAYTSFPEYTYPDTGGTMINPLRSQIEKSETQRINGEGPDLVTVKFIGTLGGTIDTITLTSGQKITAKQYLNVKEWIDDQTSAYQMKFYDTKTGAEVSEASILAKRFTANATYQIKVYVQIKFVPNGGTVSPTSKIIEYRGKTALPTAKKSGKTTKVWTTSKNAASTAVTEAKEYKAKVTTLYAYWNEVAEQCTVNFWTDETKKTLHYTCEIQKGETVDKKMPIDPTDKLKQFANWYSYNGSTKANFTKDTVINNDVDVYAEWKNPGTQYYTVTYMIDGTKYATVKNVESGKGVGVHPKNPTSEGKSFQGWYIDVAFTTQFTTNYPVTKNMTVYGKWGTGETYIITYMKKISNTYYQVYTTKNVVNGSTIDVSLNPGNFSATQTFLHWTYTQGGSDQVYGTEKVTSNKTIYAAYSNNAYNGSPYVTFDYGGCEWRNTPYVDTARLIFPKDYYKGTVHYADRRCACHSYGCYSITYTESCTWSSYSDSCRSFASEPYGTSRSCRGGHTGWACSYPHICTSCNGTGGYWGSCGASVSRYYSCSTCGSTVSAGGGSSHNSSSHPKNPGSFSFSYGVCSNGHYCGYSCSATVWKSCGKCSGRGYMICPYSCPGRFPTTVYTTFTCNPCSYNNGKDGQYVCSAHGGKCIGIHNHLNKDSRTVHYQPYSSTITNAIANYAGSDTLNYTVSSEGRTSVTADFTFKEDPARIKNPIPVGTGSYANYYIQTYTIPYNDSHAANISQTYKIDYTRPSISNYNEHTDWINTSKSYSINCYDGLSGLKYVNIFEGCQIYNRSVDSKYFTSCENPTYNYYGTLSTSGTHTVSVNMEDYAGNTAIGVVKGTYKIDMIAPMIKYGLPREKVIYNSLIDRKRYESMPKNAKFELKVNDVGREDQMSGIAVVKYKILAYNEPLVSGSTLKYDSNAIDLTSEQINLMKSDYISIPVPEEKKKDGRNVYLIVYAKDKAGNEVYTSTVINSSNYAASTTRYEGPTGDVEINDGTLFREIPTGTFFINDGDRNSGSIFNVTEVYDVKWKNTISTSIGPKEFGVYMNKANDTIGLGYRVDLRFDTIGYNSDIGDKTTITAELYGKKGTTYKKLRIYQKDKSEILQDITDILNQKYNFVKTAYTSNYTGDGSDIELGGMKYSSEGDTAKIYFNYYVPANAIFKFDGTTSEYGGAEIVVVFNAVTSKWMDDDNRLTYNLQEDEKIVWGNTSTTREKASYGFSKTTSEVNEGKGQVFWYDRQFTALTDIHGNRY